MGGVIALRGRDGLDSLKFRRNGGKAAERRRRKYQGTASAREVHAKLSVPAARKRAKVTRPSLAGTRIPAGEAGIVLGKGGTPRRTLMGTAEDFYLIFAPPRTGKTAWMSGVVSDAPGALLTTSSRVDVHAHTVVPRSAKGPVYTLNPGGDGAHPHHAVLEPAGRMPRRRRGDRARRVPDGHRAPGRQRQGGLVGRPGPRTAAPHAARRRARRGDDAGGPPVGARPVVRRARVDPVHAARRRGLGGGTGRDDPD